MALAHPRVYVYIQLPGSFDWVPCASLVVREPGANLFEGTFTYGQRYLKRSGVVALDPFHLPLQEAPHRVTRLKGIPGAVRDASPDAWGRRVIQAKLHRPDADIGETEYLLHGPDDAAGNLRFGLTRDPAPHPRKINRTHQLQALIDAPVEVFAYPNGRPMQDYDARHVAIVRRLGFKAAVSTAAGTATASSDPFQLPRFTPWDQGAWRWTARLLRMRVAGAGRVEAA